MSKSPSGEEITKFNKYFNNQWMAKTDFEKICCCSSSKIRTTNNIEGWHSRLNRYIGRKRPTLAQLLDILRKETTVMDIYKRKSKLSREFKEIDEEINDAISQLNENEISVGHCIEIISPFYSNRL